MLNKRRRFVPNNFDDSRSHHLLVKSLFAGVSLISCFIAYNFGAVLGIFTFVGISMLFMYPKAKHLWRSIGQPRLNNFYHPEMINCYRCYHTFEKQLVDIATQSWLDNPIYLPMVFVRSQGNGHYEVMVENINLANNLTKLYSINTLKGSLPGGLTITNVSLTEDGNHYTFKVIDTNFDNQLIINSSMLGLSNNAIPLTKSEQWNYLNDPHAIISGMTGSGKSYFTSYLYLYALASGVHVTVVDPKKSDLSILAGNNNTIEDDLLSIERIADNMANKEKVPDKKRQVDFLIIDELAALKASLSKADVTRLDNAITRIGLTGRSSKTILILVTQQANAHNLPTQLREQMSMRVLLGPATKSSLEFLFPDFQGNYSAGIGKGLLSISLEDKPFQAPKILGGNSFQSIKENMQVK